MKPEAVTALALPSAVAPHAGAWIETARLRFDGGAGAVAPHAGAWIETEKCEFVEPDVTVAPHAGAWIETGLAG